MAKKKYTRELAQWACGLKFEDIPERVVEECKNQMLSVLGAVFAGRRVESCMTLADTVRSWGTGAGSHSVFAGGGKIALHDALIINSAMSIALDYDDYLFAGHTGHSAVLVPLALAEAYDIDGKELIVAQTIANEIEARIGASVTLGPLNGQMWAFIHAAGAAAATARIMKLDEEQTASAIGMALAQPNHPTSAGFLRGDAKLLTASYPIVQGVAAARFAKAGLLGNDDILENKNGFCATFSFAPMLSALTGLGGIWLSDTLSYKIYPGCAYIDAPLDCVFEIMKANRFSPKDITRIDVHAGILTQKLDELALPFVRHTKTSPVTLNFYTPYNLAAALIDGMIGPEQFTEERIADEVVWNLTKKVRMHHDMKFTTAIVDNVTNILDMRKVVGGLNATTIRELLARTGFASPLLLISKGKDFGDLLREGGKALRKFSEAGAEEIEHSMLAASAEGFKMAFGARVTIECTGGGSYSYEQEVPYGAAGWNLEEKRLAVIKKFEKESRTALSDEAANRIFDRALSLDTLDNAALRELAADCAT